jgi:hypothetical protein
MSLLIGFDRTPMWHLPCWPAGRVPVLSYLQYLFVSVSTQKEKKGIFGTGVVDAVLSEKIKGVRMRGRCSKEGS